MSSPKRRLKVKIVGIFPVKTYILTDCILCLEPIGYNMNANLKCSLNKKPEKCCKLDICKNCVKKLRNIHCPICRISELIGLSDKEIERINGRKAADEADAEKERLDVAIAQAQLEDEEMAGIFNDYDLLYAIMMISSRGGGPRIHIRYDY